MKVVRKRSRHKRLSNLLWLAIALLLLAAVVYLEQSRFTQSPLIAVGDAARLLWTRNVTGDLPELVIELPFEGYNQILAQRESGLTDGVFIGNDADFVSAEIHYTDQVIPILMRLQQGPANHIGEDEKWNFDVRTRNGAQLFDMQRFYLIDPADNNWLNEWALMKNLQEEGLLASRYQFVRLILNGDDRGIYALQEGFGPELMTSQGRIEGVVVEFDVKPLWESIAYFQGDSQAVTSDPITNFSMAGFQYFEVDTFRDADIAADELLTAQKNRAFNLLRGLQSGELAAAEVFDVHKYGRFLALLDLWGATQGASLVNLRYYYNPESDFLEPIGFNTNALGSEDRLSLDAAYNDPDLQAAFAAASAEVSQAGYVTALEAGLDAQIKELQGVLASEKATELPWAALNQRQEQLQRSLSPVQPVFAFLGPPTTAQDRIIQVDVANVLNLPIEILGFEIDGATFLEVDPTWIVDEPGNVTINENGGLILAPFTGERSPIVDYVRFHLPLTTIIAQDDELDFLQDLDIQVATRIVGLEKPHLTSARPGFSDLLPGQLLVTPEQ
jgi:hypothetical protein